METRGAMLEFVNEALNKVKVIPSVVYSTGSLDAGLTIVIGRIFIDLEV